MLIYNQQIAIQNHQIARYIRQIATYSEQIASYVRQIATYGEQIAPYIRQIAVYSEQIAPYVRQIAAHSEQIASYIRQIAILRLKGESWEMVENTEGLLLKSEMNLQSEKAFKKTSIITMLKIALKSVKHLCRKP